MSGSAAKCSRDQFTPRDHSVAGAVARRDHPGETEAIAEIRRVERKFMSTIVTRMDANSDIFKKILDDEGFSEFVRGVYLKKVYEQLRDAA